MLPLNFCGEIVDNIGKYRFLSQKTCEAPGNVPEDFVTILTQHTTVFTKEEKRTEMSFDSGSMVDLARTILPG